MDNNIVYGVQLHPCGQICYFSSGEWPDLPVSSFVVLQVDKGETLAQIVKTVPTKKLASGEIVPQEDLLALPCDHKDIYDGALIAKQDDAKQDGAEQGESKKSAADDISATNNDDPSAANNTEVANGPDNPANPTTEGEADEVPSSNEANPAPATRPHIFAGEAFKPDEWDESNGIASDLEEGTADSSILEDVTSLCFDPFSEHIQPILRPANSVDHERAARNNEMAHDARFFCMQRAKAHQLDMKVVMADYFLDRSKVIFYFTAPSRIDFRELVKDLVKEYRTRIELRQIGSRHETQMVGGIGNCGMTCCCRRYMRSFAPVTIKMAKEQNLFLNPTKISGTCGRLLCCLAFEQEGYEEFHSRCPKMGKKYETSKGIVKVLRSSIFRNSISVLPEEGDEFEITLEEWQNMEAKRYGQSNQPPKSAEPSQNESTKRERRPRPNMPEPDMSAPNMSARDHSAAGQTITEPLASDKPWASPFASKQPANNSGALPQEQAPQEQAPHGSAPQVNAPQYNAEEPTHIAPPEASTEIKKDAAPKPQKTDAEFKSAGLSRFLAATNAEDDDD